MQTVYDYQKEGQLNSYQEVILKSGSPRRRELLDFLRPQVLVESLDERAIEERYMAKYQQDPYIERVAKTCCEIAKGKIGNDLKELCLYIAADTVVVHHDQIYHKPKDDQEAYSMLRSYFGKTHYVITAVCIRQKDYLDTFYCVTAVTFVPYYPDLEAPIRAYIQSGSCLDKSGSYGIQELDPRFVASIEGDIHTVIGLPVAELSRRLNFGKSFFV